MAKTWKVAIIGCGCFAHAQYLPNVTKEANAQIVAAVDIVVERARQASEQYHIPHYYASTEELIEKCDFDIDVFYNRIIIDAKSMLGVLSLDLSRELTVKYGGKNNAFENVLCKYACA